LRRGLALVEVGAGGQVAGVDDDGVALAQLGGVLGELLPGGDADPHGRPVGPLALGVAAAGVVRDPQGGDGLAGGGEVELGVGGEVALELEVEHGDGAPIRCSAARSRLTGSKR